VAQRQALRLIIFVMFLLVIAAMSAFASDVLPIQYRGNMPFSYSAPHAAIGPGSPVGDRPSQGTVPNVLGMPYSVAKRMLEDAGFQAQPKGAVPFPDLKTVGEQSPNAYRVASRGSAVMLTLH